MKTVLPLDYIVIVVYLTISLGVGIFFMKFNKGAADFFRGGNKIPWLVSGMSAFMSGFSAWTFTAASGIAYDHGVVIILMYFGNAISFLFGYWLFAVRWRRARISTPMEYLSERFDHPTRQTFSMSTVFFNLFIVAALLFSLGQFISVATQIPVQTIILVAGLITLFYCLLGGLWAVVITDFIQGIILLPFTVVLAIIAIVKFGGFSGFVNALPPEMLAIGGSEYSSWTFAFSWFVMVFFGYNTRASAQRYFSVDTEKSARKISIFNFVAFIIGAFIWFIPPMAARILYPNIGEVWPNSATPQEGAYAVFSLTVLPHGLIGIMLAALFSACMSSVSSFYNLFASILTTDIIPKYYKKPLSDRQSMTLGRITTLAIGIVVPMIAIMMSISGESSFSQMNTFNAIISLAYGPPALIGLLTKKTPHWAGLAYFIFAFISGCIGWFFLDWGIPENALYVLPFSVVIMFGANLVTKYIIPEKPVFKANRDKFFQKLATPVDAANEVGDTGNITFTVFQFLARVTTFIALFCLLFLFLKPGDEYVAILLYSGITLALAAVFFKLSKLNYKAT